jgi:dTDP-glucose 4,6-dehydratase
MKFVVLGSNSFSGSHFVSRLITAKHEILGISRSLENDKVFTPYSRKESVTGFTFVKADLNKDLLFIVKKIKEFSPEVIVNFAAQSMVAQSWDFPQHWYQTNVVSLSELIDQLRILPSLRKYVHVTTPEVYGSTAEWISENSQFSPSTPYAVSRAAGDMHLLAMFRAKNFPVVFTRTANVYGPGQALYRIVPKTIMSSLLNKNLYLDGGGTARRSFIHIDDASEATYSVAISGEFGETYHISTDELISIKELVQKIFVKTNGNYDQTVIEKEDRIGKDLGTIIEEETENLVSLIFNLPNKVSNYLETCPQLLKPDTFYISFFHSCSTAIANDENKILLLVNKMITSAEHSNIKRIFNH